MGGKARTLFSTVLGLAAFYVTGNPAFTAWTQAWVAGSALAYGAWAAREARRKAEAAQISQLEDRKIMLRAGNAPKSFVYGQAWVSGVIVFHRSPKNKDDRYFYLVMALPIAHRIEAIDQVWFGDTQVTPIDADGMSQNSPFARVYTKTSMITGLIPEGRQVTVYGDPENVNDDITLVSIVSTAIQRPLPGNPDGDDTFQDNIAPDVVATIVPGTNNIYIPSQEIGLRYTITYTFSFQRSSIKLWRYLGTDDQVANQELINATYNEPVDFRWTQSDRLRGIPYIVMRLYVTEDEFPNGLENITCLVRGKNDIFDPRNGQSGYHTNSMLVARDYAVSQCNVLPQEINLDLLIANINVCEDLITIPHPTQPTGTAEEKRYACNVVLSTEVEPLNNLGIILSSCDGSAVQSGATVDLRCGWYDPPLVALSDDDFAGPITVVRGPERPSLFNGMRCRHPNGYKPFFPIEDGPLYISAAYSEQDGGLIRTREVDLQATISPFMAHRLMKQMLHRERAALTLTGVFKPKAFRFAPEQIIYLNIRSLGMFDKPFRIKSMKPMGFHQVEMSLQEDGILLYDYNFNENAGIDPALNSSLKSWRDVPNIENLRAVTSESAAAFGPEGELRPQCHVSWNPVTDAYVHSGGHIEVRHKRSWDNFFEHSPDLAPNVTEYRFPVTRGDVLTIEARCANRLAKGRWTAIKKVADDTPTQFIQGNQLLNSRLKWHDEGGFYIYDGWEVFPQAGSVNVTGLGPAFAWTIDSDPYTAQAGYAKWEHGADSTGRVSILWSDPVPISQDWYIQAHCLALGYGCNIELNVALLDSSGSPLWMESSLSNKIAADRFAKTTVTTTPSMNAFMPLRVERRIRQFSTVSFARFELYATKTITGTSHAFIAKPFLARASAGQKQLAPWTPS